MELAGNLDSQSGVPQNQVDVRPEPKFEAVATDFLGQMMTHRRYDFRIVHGRFLTVLYERAPASSSGLHDRS